MPKVKQPQVLPCYTLLYSGYDQNDLMLDLFGVRDEDGVEVCDVALVGSRDSLGELVTRTQLMDMTHFVERRDEAQRMQSMRENQAERALWAKQAGWAAA